MSLQTRLEKLEQHAAITPEARYIAIMERAIERDPHVQKSDTTIDLERLTDAELIACAAELEAMKKAAASV